MSTFTDYGDAVESAAPYYNGYGSLGPLTDVEKALVQRMYDEGAGTR